MIKNVFRLSNILLATRKIPDLNGVFFRYVMHNNGTLSLKLPELPGVDVANDYVIVIMNFCFTIKESNPVKNQV